MNSPYWKWVKEHDGVEPIESNPDQIGYNPDLLEKRKEETDINEDDKAIMIEMLNNAISKADLTVNEKLILTLVYQDKKPIDKLKDYLPYKISRSKCYKLHESAIQKLKKYLTS